ncbi:Hypothetical predicted protein [Octopus vulgaris]|uniref:Uncharacterized protein n=1 Tax=Octopus vulgaris TaxID=6645 RepID=A0AA36B395_OCTVU|nr:Hypothetical predicted protein [Octopus vulgaris]
MDNIWMEKQCSDFTEQRLCGQIGAMRRKGWLTVLELGKIRKRVIENTRSQTEVNILKADDATLNDSSQQERYNVLGPKCREELKNEDKGMMEDISSIIEENLDMEINGFKTVDKNLLSGWTFKVNKILKEIKSDNINRNE